ncbi:MAG: FmdB family zinc ribbon protein [Bacillota bacterium]
MPVYAFTCRECAHAFEISLSMKDRESARIVCPECRSENCGQSFHGVNVGTKSTAKTSPGPVGGGCGCAGGCGCRF